MIRTSQTHPLQIAEVQFADHYGKIGITFCPGKHDLLAATGAWQRNLATDINAISTWGAKLVLTLIEHQEMQMLKVQNLEHEVQSQGMLWRHLPIADFSVPCDEFEQQWLTTSEEIRTLLQSGESILVHCKGGLGRAGMIAARLLVELGMDADLAIAKVRSARKGAIETPSQLAIVRNTQAILDTSGMQRIRGQLGSNPAGVYQANDGRKFYVKELDSKAHARNEYIAAKLYALAGAPTLTYFSTTQATQVATQWRELDKSCVSHLSETERQQAQRWFGVHAWTANWDAAGYNGDNQGVIADTVITLDVGGALQFRASGDPKGKAFGATVGELELMRQDPSNPHAVQLFGDISKTALQQAIQVVTSIPDDAIRKTILQFKGSQKLVDKMLARKADMLRQG